MTEQDMTTAFPADDTDPTTLAVPLPDVPVEPEPGDADEVAEDGDDEDKEEPEQ